MKLLSVVTSHPASVGETYLEHFAAACGFGLRLLLAGAACLVHALLPCVLQRTASAMVASLHSRMVLARARQSVEDVRSGVWKAGR